MNDQSDMKSRPRQVGEVWVRLKNDEAAVYDPATGALHQLNPSALAIWELCDGETAIEEMARAVAELTSLPLDEAIAQVAHGVRSLAQLGLVEWSVT